VRFSNQCTTVAYWFSKLLANFLKLIISAFIRSADIRTVLNLAKTLSEIFSQFSLLKVSLEGSA